jgi:outer membrane protein assembly factor BamB
MIWESNTNGEVKSSPTVIDDVVYIGSNTQDSGAICALDASDGTDIWTLSLDNCVVSSPEVIESVVYISDNNGSVYAIDSTTGLKMWAFTPDVSPSHTTLESSPTAVGDTVYFGFQGLYALDSSDGSKIWSSREYDDKRIGYIYSSPTVVNNTVYAGSLDGNIYALDASDGSVNWTYNSNGEVRSSPTVADGTIYAGSSHGQFYALDSDYGRCKWSFRADDGIFSSPTVANGSVYFGSRDGNLYALNAADGRIEWTYEASGAINSSPTVAGDIVYFGSDDGNVYGINASGGEVQKIRIGGAVESSPTVVDGIVYIGNCNGKVYAIETGTADSSEGSRVSLGTLGHHEEWVRKSRVESARTGQWGSATKDKSLITKLRELNPEDFEYFVADLWERVREGWSTKVIPPSKDEGVDVVARQSHEILDDEVELIQCKKNSEGNKVGKPKVHQYCDVMREYTQEYGIEANRMVIVTTSSFTSGAEERGERGDVTLVDKDDLVQLSKKHMSDTDWV